MKPRRKATPVVLMTPTTMPTAAAAAPTASACLAPTSKASISWRGVIRFIGFKSPTTMQAVMPQKAAM
jgi:hypothetical protein